MYHYTYLLQSQTDDMMYIGVRSYICTPEEDNYWGSSKHLPRGKGKSLRDICDKFILGRFNTREEAVADEIKRHEINDVAVSDLFWNKAKQTVTGFTPAGIVNDGCFEKGLKPWNKGLKGVMPKAWNKGKSGYLSEETIKKMSSSRKGVSPWNKGKSNCFSEEYLQQLSNRMKGKPSNMKGKHHTDKAKEKLRIAHTGKVLSDSHKTAISESLKGKAKPTRTAEHIKKIGDKMKNRRWYNNGTNVVFCHEDNQPYGYDLGRGSRKFISVGVVSIST
jgi:hypothetical protein